MPILDLHIVKLNPQSQVPFHLEIYQLVLHQIKYQEGDLRPAVDELQVKNLQIHLMLFYPED